MNFMLITADPGLAHYAESCGVSRIFVDLERLGKWERQGHLDTYISQHKMEDVAQVKSVLDTSKLLVRLNPVHENTESEIEQAIESGADILMLPMFRRIEELELFARIVDGRVGVMPLVETADAAACIHEIVKVQGVQEVYIGLNDLHLDMGLSFMFELLANGFVDKLADVIKQARLPFGFGGIARVGEGAIPGEVVLGEHLRLQSNSVILSRTFRQDEKKLPVDEVNLNLRTELQKLMDAAEPLKLRTSEQINSDQEKMRKMVSDFVRVKRQVVHES